MLLWNCARNQIKVKDTTLSHAHKKHQLTQNECEIKTRTFKTITLTRLEPHEIYGAIFSNNTQSTMRRKRTKKCNTHRVIKFMTTAAAAFDSSRST